MKAIFVVLLLAGSPAFAQEYPQQLTICHEIPPGDQKATESIVASSSVRQGTNVRYTAGRSVSLQPGFAARPGSVFAASVAPVASSKRPGDSPNLSAYAYPNPFINQTTIEYVLPRKGQVSYKLTDAKGQVLRQSTEDQEQAPGRHQTQIEAGNLPVGVYFYQLKSGSQTRTLKLLKKE